jgi:peptidoglycan/xylan/chitin deacetylase (PgdA/CDA1 family)
MIDPALSIGAGAVVAAGLAVGGCAYAAMWPASRLFGETLTAPRKPGELALTFDDGPNPAWTPRLLDELARYEIKATFFLLGSRAEAEPELVRRIATAGHTIGNHSWSHPNLALASGDRVLMELMRTSASIEELTGAPVRFFRPPFGARRPAVLRIARHLGLRPVLWNAMTSDWSGMAAEQIVQRLSARIDNLERRGWAANIVLHDGGHKEPAANRESSVGAAGLLAQRFHSTHRFVTLDAWV